MNGYTEFARAGTLFDCCFNLRIQSTTVSVLVNSDLYKVWMLVTTNVKKNIVIINSLLTGVLVQIIVCFLPTLILGILTLTGLQRILCS